MKKINFVLFCCLISFSSFAIAIGGPRPSQCHELSLGCSVCKDGTKRDPKNLSKILEVSDYKCAGGGLSSETCIVLNPGCSICSDGKFKSIHKGFEIKNLYECVTLNK